MYNSEGNLKLTYLIGLDAGTTSFKAVLFDENGCTKAMAWREYALDYPYTDWVELEPEVYWLTCKSVLGELLAKWHGDVRQIRALAISSQGETLIGLDRNGRALRPAIVWLDNRAGEEAKILKQEFNNKNTFAITGQPDIVPTWPAVKILWLKRNEPETFKQIGKFLLLEDYLIYRLTGRFAAEGSMLSSSLLFDINTGAWWPDMLEYLGLTMEQLPEIHPSGQQIGELTPQAAAETGLAQSTIVATGAMDQAAATIGAGNVRPGIITECTGGAMAVVATTEKPVFDPQQRIPCHYHALPDLYYLLPWCQTAGMTLKWFRDEFYGAEKAAAKIANNDIYDLMTSEAASAPPGADGLVMLPHLAGAFTPECNPRARGVFFGFSLKSSRAHFTRSLLESVAFMLNRNVVLLEELGIKVREIRSIGGGAKSPLWNQIKADVCQKTVVTVDAAETACLGAAMLAGQAIGMFSNFTETCRRMIRIKDRYEPDTKMAKTYAMGFKKYVDLYEALQELF